MKRTTLAVLATAAAAAAAACGDDDRGGGADASEPDRAPVVFLHGCPPPPQDNAKDAGLFTGDTQSMPQNGMTDFFAARGYPEDLLNVFVYDGATCPPNFDYAQQIADYVEQVVAASGKPRVDVVAMSMAALASRAYVRMSGGELVEDLVTIVGANHGTLVAGNVGEAGQGEFGYPYWEGAFEAFPAYACDGESGADPDWRDQHPSESTDEQVQFYLNGCLTEEGRTAEEDETPFDLGDGGHIRYLAIWNDLDDIISPRQASCLNQAAQNDCSDPVNLRVSIPARTEIIPGFFSSHTEVQFDEGAREAVFEFVSAPR
jgi:pimeloyl-ACP methyl ester carboxylesterase